MQDGWHTVQFCRVWPIGNCRRLHGSVRHNREHRDLITKVVPILHVEDPDAERRFYEQLGLRTTYEGPEYPGFIAVGNDAVEFGLSRRPAPIQRRLA